MFKDLFSIRHKQHWPSIISIVLGAGFLFFTVQVVAVVLVFLVLSIIGKSGADAENILSENLIAQLATLSLVATLSISSIVAVLNYLKEKPKKFLLLSSKPSLGQLGEVVITYVLYFIALLAAVIIINIINSIFFAGDPIIDTQQAQDLGINVTGGWSLVGAFIMLVLIPPIYEEILFRGFLYNLLKKRSSIIIAGLFTSLLFGLAHLEFNNLNWIAAIDTLIFSGFLIYISQKHKSLYSAMLLHAIKNLIAYYVLFVA
jgi:membrane protease YdiL (CAAX protease family)